MEVDWFVVCRSAVAGLANILRERTGPERFELTGTRGEGGDRTLVIDADAEAIVFDLLQVVHDRGTRFTAISEERGRVDFGSEDLIVVIDPIDGSTNAKRGLPHHAISVAVADGPTMADVFFGYVYDFGTGEEWHCGRGEGAARNMKVLERDVPERRSADGKLELVGIESADPRWIREAADGLADTTHRIRALGTIAVTLCQVAGSRMDGMLTLRPTRAVDAAAGQLMVREAGGVVCFPGFDDPLGAPLDLEPHAPIVAARTPAALEQLLPIACRE
jgi:myo-inositol-1(or 4)-monophosphatase